MTTNHKDQILKKLRSKEAVVGIIGLGYVGLPLAIRFAEMGYFVYGLDIDPKKPEAIHAGHSYLKHIPPESFTPYVKSNRFCATTDFQKVRECDALILCVPTPLTQSREPDTSYIETTAKSLAPHLRSGQIVSLESTTYPGTTKDLLRVILETQTGMKASKDFFLVYSPEREDPGNRSFHTANIPKVVGGYSQDCLDVGLALYNAAVEKTVPVKSTSTAEMVKLFENVYRSVNIALVNELKLLCERLEIDVWEVIEAASTKPFGFQAFWPGPGLGGHCIPIDPFYLTWKARQVDMSTRFIELAGEINTLMPYHVVDRVQNALNKKGKCLQGATILIIGVAYKPDVDDMRESPALKILELLLNKGAQAEYHDPFVPELTKSRKYDFAKKSQELSTSFIQTNDCVLVITNHSCIDYNQLAREANLVVDTRNCVPRDYNNVESA